MTNVLRNAEIIDSREIMPTKPLNPSLLRESRLRDFGLVMAEAAKLRTTGQEIVSLGIGIPSEILPPQQVIDSLVLSLPKPEMQIYTDFAGLPSLRNAFAKQLSAKTERPDIKPEDILVTVGAQAAMTASLQSIIDPKKTDGIMLPSPAYLCYHGQIEMAGGTVVPVNMREPDTKLNSWNLSEIDLEHALTEAKKQGINVKAVILNDPHNPTGHVHNQEEIAGLARFVLRHGLIILADYTYDEFVFDQNSFIHLAKFPQLDDRIVVIHSISKDYGMTGWRIAGAWTKNGELRKALATAHNFMNVVAATPAQLAAQLAIENGDTAYLQQNKQTLLASRNALLTGLSEVTGLMQPIGAPQGAYYLLTRTNPKLGSNGLEASLKILKTTGVVTAPGTSFDFSDGIRLSYGGSPASITKAFGILKEKQKLLLE